MAIPRIRTAVRQRLVKFLAGMSEHRGVKTLILIHDRIYFFLLQVIKATELGYHPKHRITDLHKFFVDAVESDWHVLDVGCAYGHVPCAVAAKAAHVTAIDIRPEAIERARTEFPKDNIDYVCANFFEYQLDRSFDIVIASNVLEHIQDRETFLRKCASYAPRIAIRVPAIDRDWIIPYKQELGLEWRLHPDHELEYTEEVLAAELRNAGYEELRLRQRFGAVHCPARLRTK